MENKDEMHGMDVRVDAIQTSTNVLNAFQSSKYSRKLHKMSIYSG